MSASGRERTFNERQIASTNKQMGEPAYKIVAVDRFEEPGFTELAESVFRDADRRERALLDLHEAERETADRAPERGAFGPTLRLGAYSGNELVGWTFGWFQRGRGFYMANSAVLPEFRRRSVYSSLVKATIESTARDGAISVRSRHVAGNNAVLIAKLKLGFHITGSEYSEELGLLIRLCYVISDERRKLFVERAGSAGGFEMVQPEV